MSRRRQRTDRGGGGAGCPVLLGLALLSSGCCSKDGGARLRPFEPQLAAFFAAKQHQARGLAAAETAPQPPEVWSFFAAGVAGDWRMVNRLYQGLARHTYHFEYSDGSYESTVWQPVNESYRAFEHLTRGEPRYDLATAQEVMAVIPPGSIYLGDSSAGRFLITFLCRSHTAADPFFTLTQMQMADGLYLEYLRRMYGGRIRIPTNADHLRCFQEYFVDVEKRLDQGALKPGEDVRRIDGKLQAAGYGAGLEILGRVSRLLFDQNPDREFYVQEACRLGWMNPHLAPCGPIQKLSRQPIPELGEEVIRADHDYWATRTQRLLGGWLRPETSIPELTDFAERVYLQRDLTGFGGDTNFVRTAMTWKITPDYLAPGPWLSYLRGSIAQTYAWRARHAGTEPERQRMRQNAELAYKQAYALGPYVAETVVQLAEFLSEQNRFQEALQVVITSARFHPHEQYYLDLVTQYAGRALTPHETR